MEDSRNGYLKKYLSLGVNTPIMAYKGRLRPKGVPFSGFRCMKGQGFCEVNVYERVGKICHFGL